MASMVSQPESSLPERSKGEGEQGAEGAAPSKSALKKAAKEKEKAEKAAKRQQQEQQERERAAQSDTAAHLYGPMSYTSSSAPTGRYIEDLGDLNTVEENTKVTIEARVYSTRKQSAKLSFLVIGEGDHTIQAVVAEGGEQKISRQMIKWCGGINTESIVRITGLVKKPFEEIKSTSITKYELHVQEIFMVSEAPEQLPIQRKDCNQPPPTEEEGNAEKEGLINVSLKGRLDNRVISLRAAAQQAIIELQSEVSFLFAEYMRKHKFKWIQPSYLAGAATEGGAGVFEIKYFETKAYLTQSPQFFKQMAIAGDMKRVCINGPVFRAENSNTKRHLTEFTGLDFEMTIQNHYHEVLSFGEQLMIFIIRALQTRPECQHLVNIIKKAGYPEAGDFQLPPGDEAVRITFTEAKKMLKESGYDIGEDEMEDIDTPQEKALGALMLSKYHTDFYTIDKYPRALRPFYTHPDPTNPLLTNSYDFFMRGQEIMSGAQRIHNYNDLCQSMREKGLDPLAEGFRHYTDAFRYGCAPHAGGGLGLNRIVQFFLGLNNVREATLFPRDPGRLAP